MKADNWIHRSTNMTCATCMYFVVKGKAPQSGPGSDTETLGRCRRHAPTMSGFPAVFVTDWCGDHKLYSSPTFTPKPEDGRKFSIHQPSPPGPGDMGII